MENTYLQDLTQRAISAHSWTSFSPERRGAQLIAEFEAELQKDLAEIPAENHAEYIEKFRRHLSNWIGAKSRCISSFVTGPAKFPVRRAEKANRSEENYYRVFTEWRRRAKKAINRKPKPDFSEQLEGYRADLAKREKHQEFMKAFNKEMRKGKTAAELSETFKIQASWAEKLLAPDFCGRVGFAQYELTNNLANIKRIKDRIAELEKKEAAKDAEDTEVALPDGSTLIINRGIDRIQIRHESKPGPDVIQNLKSNGFKWSPSGKVWQRQITGNAVWAVKRMYGIDLKIN